MTWRCPHCGTPQPEAARCWVCRRSSTCCATCRYFGRAVVSGVGFCLLDRRRTIRRGDELEACWTAPPAVAPRGGVASPEPAARTNVRVGRRTFVPVLPLPQGSGPEPAADGPTPVAAPRASAEDELDAGLWSILEGSISA